MSQSTNYDVCRYTYIYLPTRIYCLLASAHYIRIQAFTEPKNTEIGTK